MGKKKPPLTEPIMRRIAAQFEASGLSMHDLGVKMGYPEDSARKSVSQFFKTTDPRLSMLRRFAKAMGVSVEELVREGK
jgi:transcriptional regulator with XRE-family HTH domain